ncbi:structural maintenance of chromosomes flexible hinge domain-containing protein 1 [Cheilinus undulatus]|uniref:structural maintenance of chromosomes flexible hinge domain-containing protein 1 n=1 Tax=Cheilinus undulatus TaxID=241271 RepID=UPI001BD2F5AB|nr:structural maintenance of chromosomes flexible hinge domain-containing protein 1 [Cheilinus undulatus]
MFKSEKRLSASTTEEEKVRKLICVYDCRKKKEEVTPTWLETSGLDFNGFLRNLHQEFSIPSHETFVLSTTDRKSLDFDKFAELENESTVYLLKTEDQALPVATQELIRFTPHYNTLVESGKHEYSTCEGKKPFPYALAELVDNALSATVKNKGPRTIEIRMLLDETAGKPAVIVLDNGCGMSREDLNNWAKYRFSKFKRKNDATGSEGYVRSDPVPRSLNSDISYFGVGGKHSAFYIGESIRMISRKRGSPDVHELILSKEDFEKKEKNKEDVFSTFLRNRQPGNFKHVLKDDERFLHDLIREEKTKESFTAVVITEVQPEHITFMKERFKMLTRQLAHIYHYYIHGFNGNDMRSSSTKQDQSQKVDIQVTLLEKSNRLPSVMNLREVEDDMQTLYINRAVDTFEFRASTPDDRGKVEGLIRYHPFLYDRETYPQDPDANQDSQDDDDEGNDDIESEVVHRARQKRPIFDCFWNGRLIPKNGDFQFEWCTPSKGAKLPAECYNRFSGVLFTDDYFRVATSKLYFVDLELILKNKDIIFTRVVNEKNQRVNIQREFTLWLQNCHEKHDKQIKFMGYKDTITRPDVPTKKKQHPWETFTSIEWDGKIYSKGQLVRSQRTQPIYYGTIVQFLRYGITEKNDGSVFATGGEVELALEPKAFHDKTKIIAISKIDRTATDEAIKKHIENDAAKLPDKLRVEWPENNPWSQNSVYPAGTPLGPLKVHVLDKNEESVGRMPTVERGPGKKLSIELKIVHHGSEHPEEIACFVARHSAQWAFWFKKLEGLTKLGKYTLTLKTTIQENETVFGGRELPSYKFNFSIKEGSAHHFVISESVNATVHVGVPFIIPLQIKDAFNHPVTPPRDLEPELKCSELELSYEKVDTRGTTFNIRGVKAIGKVQNYQHSKTYDLKVILPGLTEKTQSFKIGLLPGNPHSLHVKPEDEPITVENGLTVKFDLEVHDEAGNVTANPKQIVHCLIPDLPLTATDCSSTGLGQLETKPINVTMINGEPQTFKATFEMPSKKNVAAVVREVKVVPSRRVSRMELCSEDDEKLVLRNKEKIEWLAGSTLGDLFYKLYDEAGREVPLSAEIAAKIKVTWTGDVTEDLAKGKLPDIQVPTQANREQFYQVSYQDQSVSFSFFIIPRPDEPSRLKATLVQNTVKLGETLPGNVTLELMDQYENVTSTLTSTCVEDILVEADGLDKTSINFIQEESTSSVIVTGVKFESGALGSRELCFTYKSFVARVIIKVTAGVPAELKLISGPETPLQVLNDHSIQTPFIIQLCDKWGNPSSDQRVVVELRPSPATLKVMAAVASQPVNAEGKASFTVNRVSGPKGYYQLEFIGSFNNKPIPGPSVILTVNSDPNKPVSLSVQYDTSAKFPAGGKFPVFSVTVESEEGSPITTYSPANVSMLLWEGASSGEIPPQMATELKCSKPMENDRKDCFHFRDKEIPEHAGKYMIQFSLRISKAKLMWSSQIPINVEADKPVKLGPNSEPPTPVVSYSKDISNRTLVENMTLVIMDSHGNPAGQDLKGKVLVSIRNSSEEINRNLPLFQDKSSSYEIDLVKGKAHIDRLTIMENSPGENGSSYILLFQPEVFMVPLESFKLPFHFYNDTEHQRKMFELTKRKQKLLSEIAAYKQVLLSKDELYEAFNRTLINANGKEELLRQMLVSSNVISGHSVSFQGIDRLIQEKTTEINRIRETPRRVFPCRNEYREQPDVLGMVGHLALVMDDAAANVISWHIRGDMKCVITQTTEAATRIYELTSGRQEVMALESVFVSQDNSLLPHMRHGRPLFQPRGNPVFARELLIYPKDQDCGSCEKVFKNILGNTILIDDLASGNYYRKMVVQSRAPCPTILTREGDRISAKGKFGGAQNKAPPVNQLMFGAPLPPQCDVLEAQIDLLRPYRDALKKKNEATKDFNDHLESMNSSDTLQQKQELEEKNRQLKEIEGQMVRQAKRPGDAGEPSGIDRKRARPTM